MKILLLLPLLISLSACQTEHHLIKHEVSLWKQKYDSAVFSKCRSEAQYLTLVMFEAYNRNWSVQKVVEVENFMFNSCLLHYNMFI